MRHLKRPTNVHMDHVSAVTCVDFAPTGREFVSGSYDKTVRIFPGSLMYFVLFHPKGFILQLNFSLPKRKDSKSDQYVLKSIPTDWKSA